MGNLRSFRSPKSKIDLVHEFHKLYNCSYYWGNLTKEETISILEDQQIGSYLVRAAPKECHHHLIISMKTENIQNIQNYCHLPITISKDGGVEVYFRNQVHWVDGEAATSEFFKSPLAGSLYLAWAVLAGRLICELLQ